MTKFDKRMLSLKVLNGDNNAIQTLDYESSIPYAGVWHNYRACVDDDGKTESSLSAIGEKLFEGCESYLDVIVNGMRSVPFYKRLVKQMASKPELVEEFHRMLAVSSVAGEDRRDGGAEAKRDDDEEDGDGDVVPRPAETTGRRGEYSDYDGDAMMGWGRGGGPPPSSGRKRPYEDDDYGYPMSSYSSARRGGSKKPRMSEVSREVHDLFQAYLAQQPHPSKHETMRRLFAQYSKEAQQLNTGTDHSLTAWSALADRLVDNQLLANAVRLKHKGDHKAYPLSRLEIAATKANDWDNSDQAKVQELMDADAGSVRWFPSGVEGDYSESVKVYLDPQLSVVGEVHQAAGALTLTSLHTTLFWLSDEAFNALADSKGLAALDKSGLSSSDLTVVHGKVRAAALQHSVNASAALKCVLDAIVGLDRRSDLRLLRQSGDKTKEFSAQQAALFASLRVHINAGQAVPVMLSSQKLDTAKWTRLLRQASEKTSVAPLQLPLQAIVERASKLVRLMYESKNGDKDLARGVRGLVDVLSNPLAHLPQELVGGAGGDDGEEGEQDDEQPNGRGRGGQSSTSALRPALSIAGSSETKIANRNKAHAYVLDGNAGTEVRDLVIDALKTAKKLNEDDAKAMETKYQAGVASRQARAGPAAAAPPLPANSSYMEWGTVGSPEGAEDDLDEAITLYKHLVYTTKQTRLSPENAAKVLAHTMATALLLLQQNKPRLGGVDPLHAYHAFVLRQYTRNVGDNESSIKSALDSLAQDRAFLLRQEDVLPFSGEGASKPETVRKTVLDLQKGDKDRTNWANNFARNVALTESAEAVRASVSEQGARSRGGSSSSGSGQAALSNVPRGMATDRTFAMAFGEAARAGPELSDTALAQILVNDELSVDARAAVAAVALGKNPTIATLPAPVQEAMHRAGIEQEQLNQASGWSRSRAGDFGRYISSSAASHIELGSNLKGDEARAHEILSQTPIKDCRLHHALLRFNCEVLVGLLYCWPYIRMIGGHAVMTMDKEVGSVPYITPDCLLSEDGRQKMVFYHMSMYFKAVIKNHRALSHAHFIYAKRYEGGLNFSKWNPLSETDTANMKAHNTSPHSLFVIPTLINDRVAPPSGAGSDAMPPVISTSGNFPQSVMVEREQLAMTRYRVASVMCDTWGWSSEAPNSFDPRISNRLDAAREYPAGNCLLFQCHQQSWDASTRKFSRCVLNQGHMGSSIYDGVMRSFGDGERIKDKCGDLDMQAQGVSAVPAFA